MQVAHITKNQYEQKISVYKQRRKVIQEKFNYINGKSASPEYHKAVKTLNTKIRSWQRQVKRIEQRDLQIKNLDKSVFDFIGISVKDSMEFHDTETSYARLLFYKRGMETGLNGKLLSEYVGAKDSGLASKNRLRFTRSFKFNKENLDMWHRFKNFIINNQLEIAA